MPVDSDRNSVRAPLVFDDLLIARVLYQVQPDLKDVLLAALRDARPGVSVSSLLVAKGAISSDRLPQVLAWVDAYKRQRELGIYAQLVRGEGISDERMRLFLQNAGAGSDVARLGGELVAWGHLDTARDHQLRFQARVALDHDLQGQVDAFLTEHPEFSKLGDAAPGAVEVGLAVTPAAPLDVEATAQILDETIALAAPPSPRFTVPDWVDATDPETGSMLGEFRLLGRLGKGGMGTIYLALRAGDLERPLALKILHDPPSDEMRGRFKREILAMGMLSHPLLLELHDAGQLPDGREYLLMEFFDGRTLEQTMAAGMTPGRAVQIARQLAEVLEVLHGAGVVHRDLKPQNVLVNAQDEVRLIDFGIALLVDLGEFEPQVFKSLVGTTIGTPRYMAPEQVVGQGVGRPTDLFALGLTLFEMLTGRLPWDDDESPAARLFAEPMTLRAADPWSEFLPPELHSLLAALLSLEVEERPTAKEVQEVLQRLGPGVSG